MATIRVFLLLLTTCITWFAIANPVWGAGRTPPPPPPPPPIVPMATLNLDSPTSYGSFITGLRTRFADATLQCTIPKMKKPTPAQKYQYIDLKSGAQTITLVIDTADIYVLGYRDKTSTGSERFFYFKDAASVQSKFFPGATGANRIDLGYNGNYIDLEKNAGSRASNGLGVASLKIGIVNVYGKPVNAKLQAKFLMITIQMVAEATRFKYISDKIPQDDFSSVTVDDNMTALENGWASLSNAVYQSKVSKTTATKCELATSPFKLGPFSFKTVEDIKPVVGILKSK